MTRRSTCILPEFPQRLTKFGPNSDISVPEPAFLKRTIQHPSPFCFVYFLLFFSEPGEVVFENVNQFPLPV